MQHRSKARRGRSSSPFDGDADRFIICDENAKRSTGAPSWAMCARRMIELGELKQNTLVDDVDVENLGLEARYGGASRAHRAVQVCARYVFMPAQPTGSTSGGGAVGAPVFLDQHDHLATACSERWQLLR